MSKGKFRRHELAALRSKVAPVPESVRPGAAFTVEELNNALSWFADSPEDDLHVFESPQLASTLFTLAEGDAGAAAAIHTGIALGMFIAQARQSPLLVGREPSDVPPDSTEAKEKSS